MKIKIFEDDINSPATDELTNGCDTGLYYPGNGVTRGQMDTFLGRTFG